MSDNYSKIIDNARKFAQDVRSYNSDDANTKANIDNLLINNPNLQLNADKFSDSDKLNEALDNYKALELYKAKKLAALKETIVKRGNRRVLLNRLKLAGALSIAAAVICLSFVIYNTAENEDVAIKAQAPQKESVSNIVAPTLVLHNGESIDIANLDNVGSINTKINGQLSENSLKYSSTNPQEGDTTERYNKLIIPSESIFSVTLADGTTVTLNANSSLEYPVNFGSKREVILTGEAYFDVVKSDKEFIVKANGVDVKVYGTEFNINSYSDNRVETVLVNGSVGVTMAEQNELMLLPNEMALSNIKTKESLKSKVPDMSHYLAWLDGTFAYDNTPINDVLADLSNWYGVELKIEKSVDVVVTGKFRRDRKIETIVATLKTLTEIDIIIVSK